MIRINQLSIKNIGPFKEQVFDFSIEKGHPDIHIFTGINGSGKTTLLHAIASKFDHFENNNEHKEHTSNLFYKRVHQYAEDEKEMAKSYCHAILTKRKDGKVVDKIISYGCKTCGNLHQNHEQAITNDSKINKTGEGYIGQSHNKDLANYKNAIVSKDITSKKFKFAAFGYSGYRLISSAKIKIDSEPKFNPLHLALEFVKKTDENSNISNWIISRYSKAAIEETHGNKALANQYKQALMCLMKNIGKLTNNEFTFGVKTNPWKIVTKYYGKEVEFDVLPDGLRSVLSWMGDLLMRLDEIPWVNKEIPVNHQDIILLLDEIEVHLHPKWQYQILPLTKKIFPNAQIFISTHSPFILNSIDDAKIYKLKTKEGISTLDKVILSETGDSYTYIYENILETTHKFGPATTDDLKRFSQIDQELINNNFEHEKEFIEIVDRLLDEGDEVETLISSKLFRLQDVIGKNYLNGKNK